jgi:sec-independent protein translocase protein TatB
VDFLGIGPLELMFVILIALIIIGPKDMSKTARSAGRFLNRMYRSQTWRALTQASQTIQTLPNRLAREAQLEELDALRKDLDAAAPSTTPELVDHPALQPWITPYDSPDKFQTIAPPQPPRPSAKKATPKKKPSGTKGTAAKPSKRPPKKPSAKKPASTHPKPAAKPSARAKPGSAKRPSNPDKAGTASKKRKTSPGRSKPAKASSR